ncbi:MULTISPECIES: zinc-binding dehydrogenase [Amycolatopsis]|uniref:L-threonine 3-dehydrogenase n=1 Tax=Amycolatopsis japonica TaxID=208439 RepID=A0A075UNV3_9PSEU|nr:MULTISPECIES: zinc-binding dehydrogenase [Amycolatopsis]AIG74573.1 L-threonine 3-dehydrogenase [Amycolatopsis japonica]
MTMRAAYLAEPGVVAVGRFPIPRPEEGQVLVEMRHASICGSDVHIVFDGFHDQERLGSPGYPGHEGIGVVAESRSRAFAAGDPVLTVPPVEHTGCFAEYQVVDEGSLVPVPREGDLSRLLLAQQLGTTVFGMAKFVDGPPPRTAAVIGAGSAGLFFLQLLRRMGCESVLVSDLDPGRLVVADRLGAQVVDARRAALADTAREMTGGIGVDLVVEAAGPDACRVEAVEAVRERGTIGFFGFPERKGTAPFPVERAFRKSVRMEWVNGTQKEPGLVSFRRAVDLIRSGEIVVDHCLEHAFDLGDIAEAFASARRHGDGHPKVGIILR